MSPEFALVDSSNGKIVSASVEAIPPISISPATASSLQVQWGMDILSCSDSSAECYCWSKDTDEWKTFPALIATHVTGSMSVVGDMPIVIGGHSYSVGADLGTVEIFNKTTQQWTVKSPLTPGRRRHCAVVINDTALMVIGGYSDSAGYIGSVNILDTNEMTWNELNGLPAPAYDMLCGLVDQTYVLCIGGVAADQDVNTAYGLDMALSNPEWKRKASFDLEEPAKEGFIYQFRDHLYCVTFHTPTTLRRMKSNQATLTWEIMDLFPNSAVGFVSPYVLNGFEI
ncbi:uncharacterized protein LOC131879337 [Tigriopus californicus]|uniref:uncharacterized protein LOC131879337 n=1 Tax=Tigriopus californicus TaxID=6832 RepID=UPI0027DA1528|nr:uncharacterized protein LOC131879337 [Tigriopus californicus]